MTEKPPGAEALVREGEEAFASFRDEIAASGPLPCVVRHPDAGGQCERPAITEVYGLAFCEVHGAEAKSGALEELYFDAANFLGRLSNLHVTPPNPASVAALRSAVSELQAAESLASGQTEVLRRAYPVIPERVLSDTTAFDYHDPTPHESPPDWHHRTRFVLHKLMRLAYEEGEHWLVEVLEEYREHEAAQLAAALVDYDERVGPPALS